MEIPTKCTNKQDKYGFIMAQEKQDACYGPKNMPIPYSNGVMHSHVQDCHLFDLKGDISNFNLILNNLIVVFTQDASGIDTTKESPTIYFW